MKFADCKKLLAKLGKSIQGWDDSRLMRKYPSIASKKYVGKQTYDKQTGYYGIISKVVAVEDEVKYVIDWTSYGTYGGFPKIIREEYASLEQFIVLED